jgi:hypothetical protein
VLANCQAPTYERYLHGEDPFAFHKCVSLWVFDRLLGLPGTGLRDEFAKRMSAIARECDDDAERLRAARRTGTAPALPLEAYAGSYADPAGLHGPAEIVLGDAGLVLRFAGAGAYSGVLEHWHHDVFRLRSNGAGYRDPFAVFTVGARGGVESMTVFDTDFHPRSS